MPGEVHRCFQTVRGNGVEPEQHISAMERLSASSDSLGKANLWLGGGLAALAGVQIIVMIW